VGSLIWLVIALFLGGNLGRKPGSPSFRKPPPKPDTAPDSDSLDIYRYTKPRGEEWMPGEFPLHGAPEWGVQMSRRGAGTTLLFRWGKVPDNLERMTPANSWMFHTKQGAPKIEREGQSLAVWWTGEKEVTLDVFEWH